MSNGQGDEEARRGSLRKRLDEASGLRRAAERLITEQRLSDRLVPKSVVDAVGQGDPLESTVGLDLLEAIVQRVGRPPMLIENGVIELVELPEFPVGTDALIRGIEPLVPSVGRVEFLNHTSSWGGTGWVILDEGDTRVIATNRHVAKSVAERADDGTGIFLRSPQTGVLYGAALDFKEEVGSNPGDATPFAVTEMVYLADDLSPDVALLRIAGDALPSALELADDEAGAGQVVGLVGYPAYDPRNDAAAQAQYFKDLYDVKRFAPGFVVQALGGGQSLTHDCTSLGGNSGSPLLDLATGKVVGLHFSGQYGVANSAVGVGTLRALADGDRPVVGGFVPNGGAGGPGGPGAPAPAGVGGTEGAADGTHDAAHFAGREGFDPAFLGDGLATPWPKLEPKHEETLAKPDDGTAERPFELRYLHFGVKYHLARKQPLMTAVNIDGAHGVKLKRVGDKWFQDLRIPLEAQLTKDDYADRQIDRGHLVRRQDPNWDPAAANAEDVTDLVRLANEDTFHYTNCALQHSTLNQGEQLWLGLEDYILTSAQTEGFRACVFTGPILRRNDPKLPNGLRTPREFWKLVVMPAAHDDGTRRLHATAYVLSQGDLIRELLERRSRVEAVEGFVLGAYRTFQVSVADLADATGYDFGAYLGADPLGTGPGTEAVAAGEPVFLPLSRLSQIVA
ncbi:DNA/RNA non-specific endonuclease [Agromyces sp. MMS24-K17]|uniref:DNA/RNA non-specific endonuclease n=1 Tax=Agromyces sp. MMS24-K17 TaxID=3372850 RepID=UPI003754DC77